MSPRTLLLALPLALLLAAPPQTAAQAANSPAPPPVASLAPAHRVEFTLTETGGGQPASTRHFTMLLANGRGHIDATEKVPVKSGSTYTYANQGVSLQCTLRPGPDPAALALNTSIEISSASSNDPNAGPTVGNANAGADSTVPVGQSVSLIRFDQGFDQGTGGRVYELSVLVAPAAAPAATRTSGNHR